MLTNGRLTGHHATPNNSKASAQLSHRLSSASSFCRHAFLKATLTTSDTIAGLTSVGEKSDRLPRSKIYSLH